MLLKHFDFKDLIPYRAKLDEARPCEASDIRDARMGMAFGMFLLALLTFIYMIRH